LKSHYEALKKSGIDLTRGFKAKSTREFERNVTIKLYGYQTVRQYHHDISSVHVLGNIKIPVFCLSSLDDPIVIKECIPYEEIELNPNIMLAVTRTGGHIGWYKGIKHPQRWYTTPVTEVFNYLSSKEAEEASRNNHSE
jgi:predicted alpha/beta-fold hydrolase